MTRRASVLVLLPLYSIHNLICAVIKRFAKLHHVLLLSVLLLIGQAGVLLHESQVDQHPAGELCELCLHAASLSSPALITGADLPPVIIHHSQPAESAPRMVLLANVRLQQARAPPFSA